ncbi:MAG: DNA-formamidopyrimidine glycosylase family protein [Actinomycetota bacterium]
MPEIIEVELYRRLADERAVGRTVEAIQADDEWFLKGDTTAAALEAALLGATVTGTRRIGKLMLVDLDTTTLGLRYGMTGRLLVDDEAAIAQLEYSSDRNDPAWDRFSMTFDDGGRLVVRDPRRLGGVELEPDESKLGLDAATIDASGLTGVLGSSTAPLKARLMDQARLAGLGNLLVDETLWRVGLSPVREAGSLSGEEIGRLADGIRSTIADLTERGGSHTGDLHDERHRDGHCPITGAPLRRETVGGRTTYWCPERQT